MRRAAGLVAVAALLVGVFAEKALAHGFHAAKISSTYNNRIIDDSIFTKDTTMSVSSIQKFLNGQVPECRDGYTCLKDYRQGGKSSAEIIYQAAKDFDINPRVILVTLQKEQSLVTDDFPISSQYRTAMGYGCPEGEDCNADYFGFTNQVRLGTKLLRVGVDRNCGNLSSYPGWWIDPKWALGNTTSVDGKSTTLKTCATGSLYNYTPHRPDSAYLNAGDGSHYYGNYNFVTYFNRWFGTTRADQPILFIECSGNKYLKEVGKTSKRAVTERAIDVFRLNTHYFTAGSSHCSSPTYDLTLDDMVRSRNTGNVYLADKGRHYKVGTPEATAWGLGDVAGATYPLMTGDSINYLLKSWGILPRIVKSDNTAKYYFADAGKRYFIFNSNTADQSSVELIKGQTVPAALFTAEKIQELTAAATSLDFAFEASGNWYVLDYGKVRRIDAGSFDTWDPLISGPAISANGLNFFSQAAKLANKFRRVASYYRFSGDELQATESDFVGERWGADEAPLITALLRDKIVGAYPGEVREIFFMTGHLRLFKCGGNRYMVERFISKKRHLLDADVSDWGLTDYYFPGGGRRCDYETYGLSVGTVIRSRTTGKEYMMHEGKAYFIESQAAADEWDLGNVDSQTLPQFDGKTIKIFDPQPSLPPPDEI